jgi:hypothetical protein
VEGVIEAGITFCIFTISANHGNTTQVIRRAILFQAKFFCTEFTRNNTLSLLRHFAVEADNFSSYFGYFQDEE